MVAVRFNSAHWIGFDMTKVLVDNVLYVPAKPALKGEGLMAALDVRFDSDAGDDLTVREYFQRLLSHLWAEQEGFSSKRPFGNSGWEYDLYVPLAKAGFIAARKVIDDDGTVDYDFDSDQIKMAHAYVGDLISAAFFGVRP